MSSEAIQQLCMENTQILPWIWVIEALASCKSVNTSLLLQLAKRIPNKYGEVGKNAREAVLLRILEGFAARDDEENDTTPDTGDRIKFDPSESCEAVLQHILEDTQASDVENGGLKMLKWDVQSFIASKKACFNTCVLQKLKDAIIEGSHSVIESLKERSGIAVTARYDNNIISANGGHSDELVQRHEERDKNTEAVESSKTTNFVSTEKCDDESQENVPKQNLLPAKRKRSHVTAEISERQVRNTITAEDCYDPEREASKKHKQAVNCLGHDSLGVMVTSSQHEIPVKPSENLVENVETQVHRSDKEGEANEGNLSSKMQGKNDKIVEGHIGNEGNELRTSNDTLLLVVEAPKTVDKAIKFNHEYRAIGAAEANGHIELHQDPEETNDSEEYLDETNDMNAMKNAFLNPQCPFSQDSFATQLKLCMKCNNGGQVMVCSSDTCPIVVHESCLGSSVNLDCEGRFYCPFCAYSRAISEYLEVRKRATLGRKNLAIFIGQKVDNPNLTEGSDKSKMNESKKG